MQDTVIIAQALNFWALALVGMTQQELSGCKMIQINPINILLRMYPEIIALN